MSATPNDYVPESGVRDTRIEFVRENTRGVTPDNPEYNLYSDHVNTWWDWEPDASKEANQPGGSPYPDFTDTGSVTHEGTIAYWQQQWYEDGSGNPLDAAGDLMLLDGANRPKNTHTIHSRMDVPVDGEGADNAGYRVYHVGRGGLPTEVTIPFEVDEGSPVAPELSYQWESFETVRIDQPSASTTLQIENTGTSSVDVTVEDESAVNSETLTVAGGSTVTTVATFDNIDVFHKASDTDGDIILTDGAGTEFSRLLGSDSYTAGGETGIPPLGSGSHATAIGSDYVIFNDDTYNFSTEDIAAEIISGELTVSAEVEDNAIGGTTKRNIHSTGSRATWSATVAGESTSVEQVTRYLTNEVFTIQWVADEGTVEGPDAEYFSPGTSDFEGGSGKNERSLEIQSRGVNLN